MTTNKTRLCVIAITALYLTIAPSFSARAQERQVSWKDLFSDITPCAINATIFLGGENRVVEKIATVYLEFPDGVRMFQYSAFNEPLPISISSFSSGDVTVVHDFYTDKIAPLPPKLLPLNSFSMDGDEDSFFNTIVFPDRNLDIDVEDKQIELRVESPELRISPGIYIKNVTGYLWANAEYMKPGKMVLSGMADMGDGDVLINMMMDFSYSKLSLAPGVWKKIDSAILTFQKDRQAAEDAIRSAEKTSGKIPRDILQNTK